MNATRSLLSFLLILVPLFVHAGEPSSVLDERKKGDATADRNVLFSSAETLSKGDWAFNSYQIVFAGLSYGITDRIQVSGTTLLPLVSDMPLLLSTNLKWQFFRNRRVAVTVMPTFVLTRDSDGQGGTGLGAEIIMDWALTESGKTILSAGLVSQWGSDGLDELSEAALVMPFVALIHKANGLIKLLVETSRPFVWQTTSAKANDLEFFLFSYGLRFYGPKLAVDLTFVRPFSFNKDMARIFDYLVMGLPYVTFSAKF